MPTQGATRDSLYKWVVNTAGPYVPDRSTFQLTNRELIINLQKMFYMLHTYMIPISIWGCLEERREKERPQARVPTPGSEDGDGGRTSGKAGRSKGKGKGKGKPGASVLHSGALMACVAWAETLGHLQGKACTLHRTLPMRVPWMMQRCSMRRMVVWYVGGAVHTEADRSA